MRTGTKQPIEVGVDSYSFVVLTHGETKGWLS